MSVLGNRRITLCRELTKKFETIQPTTLEEAISYYQEHEPKGEYVLVLEGADRKRLEQEEQLKWQEMSVKEHMELYESQGMDSKEAMKRVAKDRGVSKRDIYQSLL